MPTFGLMASSIVMELFLIMVATADNVYLTALHITGLMIIPCYFFTGLFLLKKADKPGIRTVAVITTLFCLWMAYAGGLKEMFLTSIFYLLGIGFYIRARKDNAPDKPIFTRRERVVFYLLCIASVISAFILFMSNA